MVDILNKLIAKLDTSGLTIKSKKKKVRKWAKQKIEINTKNIKLVTEIIPLLKFFTFIWQQNDNLSMQNKCQKIVLRRYAL